jgi:crotonobetainyl-CoA:carnitine CoA-transferase CaiB-like acyl-CoA transferase
MAQQIFAGLKVLDLTRIVAGPLCTQNMADMGATVYKIERPGQGDDSRNMGAKPSVTEGQPPIDAAMTFLAYNRGKHSVTIDISQPEGAALVRSLASHCDVMLENYKSGSLNKLGLDYDSIKRINPGIIYCSLTGFGHDGPYAGVPAYDFILQGMAGPMSTCGQPDGTPGASPMRTSMPTTDLITGLYMNVAIVSALYHRLNTGEGQYIESTLLDASVAYNGHLAVSYLNSGVIPKREGNANPIAAPSDVFACADGHLIIAAGNDRQFDSLCQALQTPQLLQDARFSSSLQRIKHRDALRELIAQRVQQHTKAHWLARCREFGVPSGPINNMQEVFEDPAVQHRGIVVEVPTANGGHLKLVRNPMRFAKTPVKHLAPPELGADTEQVLEQELNLDKSQLDALRQKGII